MDIKDIERIVQKHTDIEEGELEQIDSQSNWRRILTKQEPYEEEWEHGTTARVNEYGYRSDNFDGGGDGFMFLGCSLTEGYALEQEETWPWIVGKHFDVNVWNLGQGASGDDVCFMNAIRWIPKLKPKVVCMLIPTAGRFKFFDYDGKIHKEFFTWKLPRKPKFPWLFNPKHLYLSALKNVMGIKLICDEYNIPFIAESSTKILDWPDRARDGNHPGPKWHQRMADKYIKEIEKCI
jgi:hypothetical protein